MNPAYSIIYFVLCALVFSPRLPWWKRLLASVLGLRKRRLARQLEVMRPIRIGNKIVYFPDE
jgi:hypothetical protein